MSSYDFELETGEERRARKTQEMLDKLKKKTSKDSCIQGFHFAKDVTVKKKFFPPPVLPPNFQPRHKQRKSRFEKPAEPKPEENSSNSSNKRGLGRHALSVQERQVLLGETPAPLIPSQETEAKIPPPEPAAEQDAGIQERVERIKKFVQVLQASSSGGVATESTVSKPVFQPFLKNPEKQERYEKYLTLVSAGFQGIPQATNIYGYSLIKMLDKNYFIYYFRQSKRSATSANVGVGERKGESRV